jgi:hypothetical protein
METENRQTENSQVHVKICSIGLGIDCAVFFHKTCRFEIRCINLNFNPEISEVQNNQNALNLSAKTDEKPRLFVFATSIQPSKMISGILVNLGVDSFSGENIVLCNC